MLAGLPLDLEHLSVPRPQRPAVDRERAVKRPASGRSCHEASQHPAGSYAAAVPLQRVLIAAGELLQPGIDRFAKVSRILELHLGYYAIAGWPVAAPSGAASWLLLGEGFNQK